MGTSTRLRSPSRPRSSISRALAQIRQPGHALPLDSCTVACTSPESLQRRELVQGNRRSARLPAGKWGKCTPKRAFGGLFDVHFPAFLARKEAPARNRAKCTAGCMKSREVHGRGVTSCKESGEVHGAASTRRKKSREVHGGVRPAARNRAKCAARIRRPA